MKLKSINTMDFVFRDIEVLDCENIDELCKKIKESEVIKINNIGSVEYINSSYIMYFE